MTQRGSCDRRAKRPRSCRARQGQATMLPRLLKPAQQSAPRLLQQSLRQRPCWRRRQWQRRLWLVHSRQGRHRTSHAAQRCLWLWQRRPAQQEVAATLPECRHGQMCLRRGRSRQRLRRASWRSWASRSRAARTWPSRCWQACWQLPLQLCCCAACSSWLASTPPAPFDSLVPGRAFSSLKSAPVGFVDVWGDAYGCSRPGRTVYNGDAVFCGMYEQGQCPVYGDVFTPHLRGLGCVVASNQQ